MYILDYSNVINATGIRPHPLLAHVRVVLQQEPAALVKAIELLPGNLLCALCAVFFFSFPPGSILRFVSTHVILLYISFEIKIFAAKTKGPVGYLLKLDSIIIDAIAKGTEMQ